MENKFKIGDLVITNEEATLRTGVKKGIIVRVINSDIIGIGIYLNKPIKHNGDSSNYWSYRCFDKLEETKLSKILYK